MSKAKGLAKIRETLAGRWQSTMLVVGLAAFGLGIARIILSHAPLTFEQEIAAIEQLCELTQRHVDKTAAFDGGALRREEDGIPAPLVRELISNAVAHRDYPVVQGVVLVTATAYVLINLGVDLLYAMIDPRIRYD